MNIFSPSKTTKKVLKRKNKNDKLHHNWKSKKILPQSYFLKNTQILVFWGILNISITFVFVIFGFLSKIFFLSYKRTFVFLQKIYRVVSEIPLKLWTLWGGGDANIYPNPPRKNPKLRFRQHCRKIKWEEKVGFLSGRKKILGSDLNKQKTCPLTKLKRFSKTRTWPESHKFDSTRGP